MSVEPRVAAALDKAGHPNTSDNEALVAVRMAYKMLKGETFTQRIKAGMRDHFNDRALELTDLRRAVVEMVKLAKNAMR